jgi:hypothetical protein
MAYKICDCVTCLLRSVQPEGIVLPEEVSEFLKKLDKEKNAKKRALMMAEYLTKKRK